MPTLHEPGVAAKDLGCMVLRCKLCCGRRMLCALQEKALMFRDMHTMRNKYLARMHERLARDFMRQRMDDTDK